MQLFNKLDNDSIECNLYSAKEISGVSFIKPSIPMIKKAVSTQKTAKYILLTSNVTSAMRMAAVDASMRVEEAYRKYNKQSESEICAEVEGTYKIKVVNYEKKSQDNDSKIAKDIFDEKNYKQICLEDSQTGILINVITYDKIDEIVSMVTKLESDTKDIYLCGNISEKDMRILTFDYDFVKIPVTQPPIEYFVRYFETRLKENDMVLDRELDAQSIVMMLKLYRGELFMERDIDKLIDKSKRLLGDKTSMVFTSECIEFMKDISRDEIQRDDIIGNADVVKEIDRKAKALKFNNTRNKSQKKMPMNMTMAGNPGVGKTLIAQYIAQQYAKLGLTNGEFLMVDKSQITGKYLGHTADKMHALFEKGKGGVIFIDEASCLIPDERDIYTREALTEIVRFMELNPDTVVIFASYPDNIKRLLESDAGLSSRISTQLSMPDYTVDELYEIFELMVRKEGFDSVDCRAEFEDYILKRKEYLGEGFGNAREVRNLVQKLEEVIAVRNIDEGNDVASVHDFILDDFVEAVNIINGNEKHESKVKVQLGF